MDNMPSSSELAQRLFRKNNELENDLRKSAQAKLPSDPNIWLQMRENYESIILEDHDFAEGHSVEFTLWQLHYRRIEEFRAHINSATTARESTTKTGSRSIARPDRIKKIRSAFKSFLSEATGFYHDLIQKIRAKYGLPLGYFPESTEARVKLENDEKTWPEVQKGLRSCHRCLIYLGDLSRYKGIYGEADVVNREFAASAAYYTQAASLWPTSGNPHNQLAILASYHCDDLLSIYRYFRSLAVDNPFPTARENLIIAFEKNRICFSQLPKKVKPSIRSTIQMNGRGKGRDAKIIAADTEIVKEQKPTIPEVFKAFSTRFLRLHGILFTRTSLETFVELFDSVISDLCELLASGSEEEFNFGSNFAENGLVVVRLISIIIFSVHNVKRETEGQSYAEILQRSLLLQHAFTVAFEFAGHIVKRCLQLSNASSSYLLPGILIFIEWLACHPDIALGEEGDDKLFAPRTFFWNQFVAFTNKIIQSGIISIDFDGDDACFSQMSMYNDGETNHSLALWEDFELRGFLPLASAQAILDFSTQHSVHGSLKEEKYRMQRIITAGKILMNVVKVDHGSIYFDSRSKMFVIGNEPLMYGNCKECFLGITDALKKDGIVENLVDFANQVKLHGGGGKDGEEEEEEIVFKPTIADKYQNNSLSLGYETNPAAQCSVNNLTNSAQCLVNNLTNYVDGSVSAPQSFLARTVPDAYSHVHVASNPLIQPMQNTVLSGSKWTTGQEEFLSNSLRNLKISEQMHGANGALYAPCTFQRAPSNLPLSTPASCSTITSLPCKTSAYDAVIPSKLDSVLPSGSDFEGFGWRLGSGAPVNTKKKPVSRPVRHLGPPPGFSPVPPKLPEDLPLMDDNIMVDDFSWLDGYTDSTTKKLNNGTSIVPQVLPEPITNSASFLDPLGYQFSHNEISNNNAWSDFPLQHNKKLYPEQGQYHAQWSGFV